MGFQQRLMQVLEQRGLLDRVVEYLPDDSEISERRKRGQGLTRPELAVLLAYAKLTLYSDLLESSVPDDPYLGRELSRYFPSHLVERYPDALENHRLRREIISTQLTNSMINRGGPSFAVRIGDQTGASAPTIAAAFFVVRNSYDMIALNSAIDALDNKVSGKLQLDLYAAIEDLLIDRIVWFVRNVDVSKGLADVVEHYRAGIEQVTGALNTVLPPDAARVLAERTTELVNAGVPKIWRASLRSLRALAAAPDIVSVADRTGKPVQDVAATYYAAGAFFQLDRIANAARGIQVTDYFDRLALDRALELDRGVRAAAHRRNGGERRHRAGGRRGVGLAARRRGRAHPRGGARHREFGAHDLQALGRGEPAGRSGEALTAVPPPARTMTVVIPRRAIVGWVLFDWAAQPFFTLIITFVYAPYFASAIAPDPVRGQALWGFATAAAGFTVALLSPVLGSIADASGRRKPWIAAFTVLVVVGSALLWLGKPGDASVIPIVLTAYAIGVVGVEFAGVFTNAMMPSLVPPERLGRLSGTGWAVGYVGGLIALILVLGFLAANPQTGKTLLGMPPLFGLDPVLREGDRAVGPLSAVWLVVFILPLFLFTPDRPAGLPLARGGVARPAHARRNAAAAAPAPQRRGVPAGADDLRGCAGRAVCVRRHLCGGNVRLDHDPDRIVRHPAGHHGDDRRLCRRQARRPRWAQARDARQPSDSARRDGRDPLDRTRSHPVRRAGRAAGRRRRTVRLDARALLHRDRLVHRARGRAAASRRAHAARAARTGRQDHAVLRAVRAVRKGHVVLGPAAGRACHDGIRQPARRHGGAGGVLRGGRAGAEPGESLVPEVPRAGEHHRDAVLVGGLDHLIVAH